MVNKCCAIGCKTNYQSSKENQPPDVSVHSFPKDEAVAIEWHRRLHRDNFSFEQAKKAHLCSLHFLPEDFVNEREDTNKWRKRSSQLLKRFVS